MNKNALQLQLLKMKPLKNLNDLVLISCQVVQLLTMRLQVGRSARTSLCAAEALRSVRRRDMGLLEDIVLTDSIEIKSTPEKIFPEEQLFNSAKRRNLHFHCFRHFPSWLAGQDLF